jgi:hypothetical protein
LLASTAEIRANALGKTKPLGMLIGRFIRPYADLFTDTTQMPTTLDVNRLASIPAPVSASVLRGTVSTGWILKAEVPTPAQIAQHNFTEWSRVQADFDKVASANLYENVNFTPLDIRLHRAALHEIIGQGEQIAAQFVSLDSPKETESYVSFIDEQLKRLLKILWEWHGPTEHVERIPEDFMIGMREISEGKTVDMEKALSEAPVSNAAHG